MKIRSPFKKMAVAMSMAALLVAAFLIHALAGLGASPIVFADPPSLVQQHAMTLSDTGQAIAADIPDRLNKGDASSGAKKITEDIAAEKALVHRVFFDGESPDLLFQLFAHPDKSQRVKIAAAFSAINVEFTHDEESGFPKKREAFWKDAEGHLANMRNALFEALITSAEENTVNQIPYTLAWMPGQGQETVEVLAWAAKHHPNWWIRRFSVFFVAEFGQNEPLAEAILSSQTHDPDYRVRREVLDQRMSKILGS
ncbi:hypothetical protein [Bowmanella dokdonensis]|uniref:HEAT repeat domain-containing protein n=1 Tax=Bowmanella dokdonensis TaxID=751969 RepID=A0A939DP25_9ALTE|nr:hypothetical protein [Bowmanella dokdonensis]MBN7826145.1 hypothetical protein [Bowmanella dokdonensis]